MQSNMAISKQRIFQFGGDMSMCSQADSHASLSVWQGTEKEQTMTATYGRKCCEQFKRFGHVGLWARMFVDLLVGQTEWYSKRCALTWKMQGMKYNRFLFQLVPSMRLTEETESGLLPTVMTQGLKICGKNGTQPINLKMLPTPTAIDKVAGRENKSLSKNAVARPTLALAAKRGILPTPTVNDATNSSLPKSQVRRKSGIASMIVKEGINEKNGMTSRLNPLYVAEMMGFPVDWTVLPFLHGAENQSNHTEMQ